MSISTNAQKVQKIYRGSDKVFQSTDKNQWRKLGSGDFSGYLLGKISDDKKTIDIFGILHSSYGMAEGEVLIAHDKDFEFVSPDITAYTNLNDGVDFNPAQYGNGIIYSDSFKIVNGNVSPAKASGIQSIFFYPASTLAIKYLG